MLIEDWMKSPVHAVKPLDSIAFARRVMVKYRVNQLPVVRDDQLVGIITDRDLRDAFPSVFGELENEGHRRGRPRSVRELSDPETIQVELVMTGEPIALAPSDTLEEAAKLMCRKRIGAIPIAAHGKLVGIVTRSDVLNAFLALARDSEEATGA